jgi:hypothetical protein
MSASTPSSSSKLPAFLSWGSSEKGTKSPTSSSKSTSSLSPAAAGADPSAMVSTIVKQFIATLATKAESAGRPRPDVEAELHRKKGKVVATLRSGFDKNKVVESNHVNELCSKLDRELNGVIAAYLKSVGEGAVKAAQEVMPGVVPKDAGEVGVSLPPLSDAALETALTQKRAEVRAALVKAAAARCHASWYGDEVFPALEVRPI